MSILAPLLEGQRSLLVPGKGPVEAQPGFRFFATQNPSAKQYAGRNKLPPSLRSRFLEAQVQDFDARDIFEIFCSKVCLSAACHPHHTAPRMPRS